MAGQETYGIAKKEGQQPRLKPNDDAHIYTRQAKLILRGWHSK